MDLTSRTVDGVSTLVPTLSAKKMDGVLGRRRGFGGQAGGRRDHGQRRQDVWVVPAADGQTLDREKTAAALTQAALWVGGRTAEVVLTVVEPDLTTGEVEAMGIGDLLGSYATTPYRGSRTGRTTCALAPACAAAPCWRPERSSTPTSGWAYATGPMDGAGRPASWATAC